jgi:chromosome segregation ATPase
MGVDPSALDAAQREISALKEEVDRLRTWGSKGEELTDTLTEKLTEAKERMEKVRRQLQERDDEIHALRAQRGQTGKQTSQLEQQLGEALSELREVKEKRSKLEQALAEKEQQIEASRKERETARVDAKRLKLEMGILEQQSQEDMKKAQLNAEGQLGQARAQLEKLQAKLEASQSALESLGVQRSGELKASAKDTGLDAAMKALGLKPTQQAALEDAVSVHVDAESLRRFAGPALTWRVTDSEEQVRRARSLRGRAERVELAISLGIDPPK